MIEIERKYLLRNDGWKSLVTDYERLTDGLVFSSDGRKLRVRLSERRATLTIKSKQENGQREEFEYEIPRADAERLLAEHCGDRILHKTRHYVPYAGLIWEIDVYEPLLAGVVIAEVELPAIEASLHLPDWVGDEVTGKPEYKKINMLRARQAD